MRPPFKCNIWEGGTPALRRGALALLCIGLVALAACRSGPVAAKNTTSAGRPSEVEIVDAGVESEPALRSSDVDKWGIDITGLRLSAGGYMLDFRYKVLDPAKASALAKANCKPYLIDQASGARFAVCTSPQTGPLRQVSNALVPGAIYFVLFTNPGRYVKAGNKVTVVIGEFRAEDVIVE